MSQMTLPTLPAQRAPRPEDEGLSLREIHWLPLVVPLCALMMLLGAAAIMLAA